MQADQVVHRLPEEAGAWNGSHPNLPRQCLAEGHIAVKAKFGDVQQNIIGSLRVVVNDA